MEIACFYILSFISNEIEIKSIWEYRYYYYLIYGSSLTDFYNDFSLNTRGGAVTSRTNPSEYVNNVDDLISW